MKKFEVYKDIRKKAMLMGLPLALFAILMIAIIASLLIIIFSFSFLVISIVFIGNATLYIALTHITKNPALLHFQKVFPITISNKKACLATSNLHYEEN